MLTLASYGCFMKVILNDILPKLIGVWSGSTFRSRILVMVARHLNRRIIYFENGILPNTTTLDDKGVNAHCSLPRDENFYFGRKSGQSLFARRVIRGHTGVPPELPKCYVFVPFQGEADFQLLLHSTRFKTMREFLEILKQTIPCLRMNNFNL